MKNLAVVAHFKESAIASYNQLIFIRIVDKSGGDRQEKLVCLAREG